MTKEEKEIPRIDPNVMLRATANANSKNNKAYADYYGGNSVERRLSGGMPDLGGGTSNLGYLNGYGSNVDDIGGFGSKGSMYGGGNPGFTYLKNHSTNCAVNHNIIASCMIAYLGYGVVRNIIDLYTDFATEGLSIHHQDASVKRFYDAWAKKVGLSERVSNIFMNSFVTGNAFIHRRWASLTEGEKRAMKRAEAVEKVGDDLLIRGKSKDQYIKSDEDVVSWFLRTSANDMDKSKNTDRSIAEPKTTFEELIPENKRKRIPWGYTLLNPLQMEVRGSRIEGRHYWVMAIDQKDTLEIAKRYRTNNELGTTKVNLPKEFVAKFAPYSGPGAGYTSEVKLSKEDIYVLQGRKFDWWDWSVPFVWPALRSLNFKDCLRNMEAKACTSVINSVTLFKLGNIEKGLPAEEEHFDRLADMLKLPGQAINILWNEAIEAEVIQPNIAGIFDPKKHESADRDILTSLGVPDVLLGGKGGNFSNSYIAVSQVLERLESAREIVKQWLMGEMKIIADAMGFRKLPEVRFGSTSLTDKGAEQNFKLALFDRGILSADTALEEANTSYSIEQQKLSSENSKNVKGPFVQESGEVDKKENGRPSGTKTGPTGKQDNQRGPKGQGLAQLELYDDLLMEARECLDFYEDRITGYYCTASNIKYVKQAPAKEKDRLEQLIFNVFSHMPRPTEATKTDDFIISMLNSSEATDETQADVLSIYANKIKDYKKKYGKSASREMRRQFMVSSWTQHAITNTEAF